MGCHGTRGKPAYADTGDASQGISGSINGHASHGWYFLYRSWCFASQLPHGQGEPNLCPMSSLQPLTGKDCEWARGCRWTTFGSLVAALARWTRARCLCILWEERCFWQVSPMVKVLDQELLWELIVGWTAGHMPPARHRFTKHA